MYTDESDVKMKLVAKRKASIWQEIRGTSRQFHRKHLDRLWQRKGEINSLVVSRCSWQKSLITALASSWLSFLHLDDLSPTQGLSLFVKEMPGSKFPHWYAVSSRTGLAMQPLTLQLELFWLTLLSQASSMEQLLWLLPLRQMKSWLQQLVERMTWMRLFLQ